MGWLVICLVSIALPILGFSFNSIFLYAALVVVSFYTTYLFLTKKWELDVVFDVVFKLFELFGFGAPHRLDNPLPCSTFFTSGSYNHLEEIPKPLEESLKKLLGNIIRDFICSWYSNVGKGESFISDTRRALEMLCLEGYTRASQIDSHYLIEQVIAVFHGHLERFHKALAVLKSKDPKLRLSITTSQLLYQTYESQLRSTSPSFANPTAELTYLRSVIDSLLAAVIPKDTFRCDTGRFILREILTVKIMEPLATLLTDPDWVNEALVDILKENGKMVGPRLAGDIVLADFAELNDTDLTDGRPQSEHECSPSTASSVSPEPVTMKPGAEQLEAKHRKKSDELTEDQGERIEITAEQRLSESVDFQWSITSQRQSPLGESEHENSESFLVISVDESRGREGGVENTSHNGNNWSMEVVPSSSIEHPAASSLSSSWGFCPSPQDKTFQSQSYQNMKEHLLESKSNADLGAKLGEFGQSIKDMTCCHIFEESGDVNSFSSMEAQKGSMQESGFSRSGSLMTTSRSRSLSHLNQLCSDDDSSTDEDVFSPSGILSRSASVPCKFPIAEFSSPSARTKNVDPFSGAPDLRRFYGSPFYSTSYHSSSDSFKSVSSDDDNDEDVGLGEEATIGMVDSQESGSSKSMTACSTDISSSKLMTRKPVITKQDSFDENYDTHRHDLAGERFDASERTLVSIYEHIPESFDFQAKKDSSEFDCIKEVSNETAMDKGNSIQNTSSSSESERLTSELSIGDVFLNASKKFVSNFKPPFKFDSGSSSSGKSTEGSTASGGADHNSLSSQDDDLAKRELGSDLNQSSKHSVFSGKKLSRSAAVVEESLESDVETCYGTPRDEPPFRQEIAYSSAPDVVDGFPSDVIRIHPSQLISIPATVVALETTWEPGRNKYTLYKIEYDIRIWREVYSAAVKEAKKERLRQKRYESKTSEPEDKDLSLDTIKKEIPLKRLINRRYREFMELHNRLTGSVLGVHMKDILKPNRKYNLPFGRLDPHVVEGRRRLLQYYLVSLVSKPPLRNSEELKQFLGVTGGEHVSFVKPSVAQIVSQSVHVPRVDKMLSRQMTKMIDSIKTAFDSVEEAELASEEQATAAADSFVPWKLECGQTATDYKTETDYPDINLPQDCYQAFLVDREEYMPLTPPHSLYPVHELQDQEDGVDEPDGPGLWGKSRRNKVVPYDSDEDTSESDSHRIRQPLGPRTAGDGSDNPDEPTAFAYDDMLLGLGSQRAASATQTQQRERSGAMVKEFLNITQSNVLTKRPLGLSLSQPPSRSESMDLSTAQAPAASSSKFPFKPHKFLEAAKRIGHGTKSGSADDLNTLSGQEKKPSVFKKFLKDPSLPILTLSSSSKNRKKPTEGSEVAPLQKTIPLRPEEPCAQSRVDQPSDMDEDPREVPTSSSDLQCSLLDALLSFSCELFQEHRSWVTVDRVQQGIIATLGGLCEWYLQRGIDDITSDERWAYYLGLLNEAIWPGGKLQENKPTSKTEEEMTRTKNEAIQTLMDAFPGVFRLMVGPGAYHKGIVNVIESLQHPQINKILLYSLLELLLSELVPEIQDDLQFLNCICAQRQK